MSQVWRSNCYCAGFVLKSNCQGRGDILRSIFKSMCLRCGGLTVIGMDYLRSNYQGRGAILRSFFIHV